MGNCGLNFAEEYIVVVVVVVVVGDVADVLLMVEVSTTVKLVFHFGKEKNLEVAVGCVD